MEVVAGIPANVMNRHRMGAISVAVGGRLL